MRISRYKLRKKQINPRDGINSGIISIMTKNSIIITPWRQKN